MDIVVATGNKNKLAELKTIATKFGLNLLSPREAKVLLNLSDPPEVDETGETFQANALLKAQAFLEWSGLPSLGDDSGIEVDALGGRPGIHSARYAGPQASDSERIEKLVRELGALGENVSRTARFRCSLALCIPHGKTLSADGTMEGEILHETRGTAGFGYDPILFIYEIESTLAEVDFSVTCERGFRAKAAKALFEQLKG